MGFVPKVGLFPPHGAMEAGELDIIMDTSPSLARRSEKTPRAPQWWEWDTPAMAIPCFLLSGTSASRAISMAGNAKPLSASTLTMEGAPCTIFGFASTRIFPSLT